jgi:xanthine dehydrogenase accessory factor
MRPPIQDRHPGTGWQEASDFHLCYAPALRIVALGQGDDLLALARLATSFGASVQACCRPKRAR